VSARPAEPSSIRSRDGTSIAFDRTGGGPPIIVIGGALSDRADAAPLAAILARRFTVYAYDRRGRGASGDTPPYGVAREVEDLEALVVEAGGSAFVFGHSSGAVLALEAAARGVAIERLALYEPPFIVDGSRPPVREGYVATLKNLTSAGRRGDAVAFFLAEGVGLPPGVVDGMRNAPMWPEMERLSHTLAYDGAIMADHMSGTPLPAAWSSTVTAPALVMDGGGSPAWQRAAVRALAEVLPNAQRRTLERQDHTADPEVLGPVLVEFFAG
jgi:pimeloyl-ACP methyl ester carboxylesterase